MAKYILYILLSVCLTIAVCWCVGEGVGGWVEGEVKLRSWAAVLHDGSNSELFT